MLNLSHKEEEINARFGKVKQKAEQKEREITQKQKELDEFLVEMTKIQGEYRLLQELKDEQEGEKYDEVK